MGLYNFLVQTYSQFLGIFPAPVQWLVTIAVLVALAVAFFALIRHGGLMLILLVVLVPIVVPVLQRFFSDLYRFFVYLLQLVHLRMP